VTQHFPNGEPVKRFQTTEFWLPIMRTALGKLLISHRVKQVDKDIFVELIHANSDNRKEVQPEVAA
jgi:hypothetical protein